VNTSTAHLAALVASLLATLPGALLLTLGAYAGGQGLQHLARAHVLANPLLLAVALVVGALVLTGLPYARYFQAAAPLHFLLGPATVALAIPLYRHGAAVRQCLPQVLGALAAGSACATLLALALAFALQAKPAMLASIAPKTVTTPVAMAIAQSIGGVPGVAAVIVVVTGIVGYAFGPALLDRVGVRDPVARGIAYGTAAHIMGVARAAQESEQTAAMAGFAMALNALVLASALPALWLWTGGLHARG
jgi:predicted murein hydrolase (TIGR00659 family)